jgi:hypothetical protein
VVAAPAAELVQRLFAVLARLVRVAAMSSLVMDMRITATLTILDIASKCALPPPVLAFPGAHGLP